MSDEKKKFMRIPNGKRSYRMIERSPNRIEAREEARREAKARFKHVERLMLIKALCKKRDEENEDNE